MLLRRILQVVSCMALIGVVLPSCLYMSGSIELDTVKTSMQVSTIIWFAITLAEYTSLPPKLSVVHIGTKYHRIFDYLFCDGSCSFIVRSSSGRS